MAEPEVTQEQAEGALKDLMGMEQEVVTEQPTVETAPVEEVVAPVETEAAPVEEVVTTEESVVTEEAAPDDLASLQARNKQLEEDAKTATETNDARFAALQQRSQQNDQIMRDRYLRKSSAGAEVLKILRNANTDEGVSQADVDRAIAQMEGTMNPASSTYAPAPQQPTGIVEDQTIVLNNFLNEKGMTIQDADTFGQWIRTEAPTAMSQPEQDVAGHSIDGFLRIAHTRWQEGVAKANGKVQRNDAVEAVRTVQRTQKQAARAASSTTAAPRKQPAGTGQVAIPDKLSDEDIDALLKQAVNDHRPS